MLDPYQIQNLNDLELLIYNYIIENSQDISNLTLKQLSETIHISPTSIIRFCKKCGCNGFLEFKIKYKLSLQNNNTLHNINDCNLMIDFFNKINNQHFNNKIIETSTILNNSDQIICIGLGNSLILAKYANRYFRNIGKTSILIDDCFYIFKNKNYENTTILAFSVSGETIEILNQVSIYKVQKAKIISITNKSDSTLSKISNININYYIPEEKIYNDLDITSQIPAMFIIEQIAKQIYLLNNKKN